MKLTPLPWMADASCRNHDPALWYPEARGVAKRADIREALAICASCPVNDLCLEYALDNNETHGIWGGVTEEVRQRRKRGPKNRRVQRSLLKPCGTLAAYQRHLRAGEKPCDECAEASREDCRLREPRRTRPRKKAA